MKKDIRFLLTQRCNYDCYFCHNEGVDQCMEIQQELTVDEYIELFSIYSNIENWNGVTLSGGEPLLYREILELTKRLRAEGALITLVTNGYLLIENLDALAYVDRINVSIHTMNEEIYENIVRRRNVFHKVIYGLKMARAIYPELKIKLNITPSKDMNWSEEMLTEIIEFSKSINASIKFTELFPKEDANCVPLDVLSNAILKLGYIENGNFSRSLDFSKESHHIFLTQCTCSKAMETENPVEFCRNTHDLYVNHTGHFMLCRLGNERLEFLEDLREKDYKMVKMKMEVARRRVSRKTCNKYLGIK